MKTSKTTSGSSAWLALLVCGIALVALSIATFVNAEKVLGLLIYIAGVALCGAGVALGVSAFLPGRREERPRLLTLAAGNVLLGALVMIFSRLALIFVGVALAVDGVGATLNALRQRKLGQKGWLANLFLGVALSVFGVVVVVFHGAIQTLIGSALGLLLLIAGLSLSIIALLLRSPQQKSENLTPA
ncbi:MAG: DUF308 domain-containing protein [Prevotellaceae bacterium]|jgi:uncharacterized membrane protein HdeD (DUF308 family)|nr:DUF308 domain-containing protein [Prevotellaceae bacterium]